MPATLEDVRSGISAIRGEADYEERVKDWIFRYNQAHYSTNVEDSITVAESVKDEWMDELNGMPEEE